MLLRRMRSPVRAGAFVVATLATLVVSGCTTATGVVFRDLLGIPIEDAAPAGLPSPSATGTVPVTVETDTWFTHRAGYAMELPPGWVATDVSQAEQQRLLEALADADPDLGQSVGALLADTGLRISMVGADLRSTTALPPLVMILSEPIRGQRPAQVSARIAMLLAGLPGLAGEVTRTEDPLPTGDSLRFDLVLEHGATGRVVVRGHLVRFAGSAYLVVLAAPEALAAVVAQDFEAILETLRFGV
jgi:hypothetical protein